MEEVLRNLSKEMGVTGSAIVSKDGLVIASSLDQDEESVAGMAASVFQSASTTSGIMAIGTIGMITLESDKGKAFMIDLRDAYATQCIRRNHAGEFYGQAQESCGQCRRRSKGLGGKYKTEDGHRKSSG